MPRIRILNVDIDNTTMDQLLQRTQGTILTVHVDMLAKLQRDREFYDLVSKFDVVTCDSQVLYFASKLMRRPFKERVSGSDFLPMFYDKYRDDASITIFLCGAEGDIAERAMAKINGKVGRNIVVGAYGPPLGFENDPAEIERVLAMINASGATVLVVGLGAPKQERFIFNYRDHLPGVQLFLPLGGTIDYEAGAVVRPPKWVTTIGLEWLFRVVREPRRRWKRYFVQQPPVLYHLFRDALGRYRDPFASE